MKKLILSFCILMMCFNLTACDPGSYSFDYNELENNITSIELINYDNPEQKHFVSWVPNHSDDLVPFNDSKLTILETLDDDKKNTFLAQLSEADILYKYYAYDSPKGICLKLSYDNGDFFIISCNYEAEAYSGYIGKYSADGNVTEFIGSFSSYYDFKNLINDYFDTKLPTE